MLVRVDGEEEAFVPAWPLCYYLGVDWSAQRKRIVDDAILSEAARSVAVTATEAGGRREMLCLPLDLLNDWLFGSARRVSSRKSASVLSVIGVLPRVGPGVRQGTHGQRRLADDGHAAPGAQDGPGDHADGRRADRVRAPAHNDRVAAGAGGPGLRRPDPARDHAGAEAGRLRPKSLWPLWPRSWPCAAAPWTRRTPSSIRGIPLSKS